MGSSSWGFLPIAWRSWSMAFSRMTHSEGQPAGSEHGDDGRESISVPGYALDDAALLMLQALVALVLASFGIAQLRALGLHSPMSTEGGEGYSMVGLLHDLRIFVHFVVGGALCLAFRPEMRPGGLLGASKM